MTLIRKDFVLHSDWSASGDQPDSVAALTPQAEIDGKIGESQLGLQARLMSYALRRLTSIVSKTNCVVIFFNQLRALISTGYGAGPTETTTGAQVLLVGPPGGASRQEDRPGRGDHRA